MKLSLKNKVLIIGFIISLFIVYKLALSKTIETSIAVSQLSKEQITLSNISNTVLRFQLQEKKLDSILKNYNLSIDNSFQQSLLKNITQLSKKHNLQILAFDKPHEFKTNFTKLSTYSFEIKGDFISILKMINKLETLQLGELISIDFEKKTNFKTGVKFLTCKVLLQKIGE
jgi:hypothetical protein